MPVSQWKRLLLHRWEVREGVSSSNGEDSFEGPCSDRSSTDGLSLPSADEPLHFDVSLSLEAYWGGNVPAPSALMDIAWAGLIHRAAEVSRQHALTATERLRVELNAALVVWWRVGGTNVYVRGQCSSVDADAELVAAVAAREEATRRHVALSWQNQQRSNQEERMCSVLLDPLRATASWFLDNQDKPEQVVAVAQQFHELREVMSTATRSESVGQLVDKLLVATDETVHLRVISTLRKVFINYNREDLAARLDERGTGETSDH
ncbi:hypothetical protein SAMN04487904_101517 [Actinopolyspora lacussalsi subsp. righensis]|uniref:Uncharacterized protein n=1 Tax=Actinopolyspora righensis TaxID=995060 RepID=A0A1I6XEB8_9ACTN|nr:hypothetical protein SAMN04487904_101517 [Actinopolyspora righensis]